MQTKLRYTVGEKQTSENTSVQEFIQDTGGGKNVAWCPELEQPCSEEQQYPTLWQPPVLSEALGTKNQHQQ